MTCELCNLIQDKEKKKLFEDELVVAVLSEKPAVGGHVLIMPKQHFPILEQIPDELIEHMFNVANRISAAMFGSLEVNATNMIINNGVAAGQEFAHFSINLLPRTANDGLNFQWQPRQVAEEEMNGIEAALKAGFEPKKEVAKAEEEKETISGRENLLIKQLERQP
jgi:histidine triad (HIT) family protein